MIKYQDRSPEGRWGDPPPPDFGRPVHPVPTKGEDYAHHITNHRAQPHLKFDVLKKQKSNTYYNFMYKI